MSPLKKEICKATTNSFCSSTRKSSYEKNDFHISSTKRQKLFVVKILIRDIPQGPYFCLKELNQQYLSVYLLL